MSKIRHINIPLFIQHMGCPNQCVFCDQRAITGAHSFCFDKVREDIESVLSTADNAECEIAFFGGSFTGIDRELMIKLLDIAHCFCEPAHIPILLHEALLPQPAAHCKPHRI